jgi:lipoprotein-releasing system ATP-binding protein
VGPSGAGKSTLLQLMGTLDKPDSGEILFNGKSINGLRHHELAKFRNSQIGFVFQFHNLLPEFSAWENVCIPAFIAGKKKGEAESEAKQILCRLGLESRMNHRPTELSGGEQQRVAIARALINRPMIVLADEPSGNLDSGNANDLHNLFFTLREELNQTFVIVTHNDALAATADRKIEMRDGKIIA